MEESLEAKIQAVVERIDDLIQSRQLWENPAVDQKCVVPPHVHKQELKKAVLEMVREIWR